MHKYVGKQGGGMAAQEEGHKRTFSKKGWFFENNHLENNLSVAHKNVYTQSMFLTALFILVINTSMFIKSKINYSIFTK